METFPAPGELGDDDWRELNERADRFAVLVAGGPVDDWEEHLTGLLPPVRFALLVELVKIDLAEAWKRGRKPILDDYRSRFRELADPKKIPARLIAEEIRIRQSNGDLFDVEAYLRQYPGQASEIRDGMPASGTVAQTTFPALTAVQLSSSKIPRLNTELTAVGNYQLREELGRGQFGRVYKAIAPGGVEVAIKVIPRATDGNEARKERGALQLVKNLRHPHLLPVLAYWENDNNLYIVMELADGTLNDRLRSATPGQKTPLPKPVLLKYVTEAAGALDFLHSNNLLHRDIKPANILLVGDFAKLGDFGLARQQTGKGADATFAGTPSYMPPEAWASRPEPASDQYSLALSYVELRLGKRLVDGDDQLAVMSQHIALVPEFPGLPANEQAALKRALSKKAEDRFPNCMEFARALADQPPASKAWLAGVGLAAVALAVGGYFAWPMLHGERTPETPPDPPPVEQKKATEPAVPAAKKDPTPEPPKKEPPKQEPPKSPAWRVPAGYTAAPGAKSVRIGEREYPGIIQREAAEAGTIRFLLIEPRGVAIRPFYAQEHKVSNALVERFVRDHPGSLKNTRWSAVANAGPAMNLRFAEAREIAASLGGRLPTPEEWDAMTGLHEPNRPDQITLRGRPAVGIAIPRSLVDQDTDRGVFDLCDLAGNGREYTAAILTADGAPRVPAATEDDQALLILRGRMHTLADPLTWETLKTEQKTPQTQYFGKPSPYTGFRVIVDLD